MFGYVGAALQVLTAVLIVVSVPIAPPWLVMGLLVFVGVTSWWSWRRFASNFMVPTFVGTTQSVLWMVLVGVGVGIYGWGR